MKLIIGLGNPGNKYEKTRHNAGFIIIEEIRKECNFPDFKFNKKIDTEISIGKISVSSRAKSRDLDEKIILAKPQSFMNNSGSAVKKLLSYYKLPASPAGRKTKNLIVIHDDLDIELGKFKISADSSSAGHNGVQSIIDTLGTKNFVRIRMGIEGEEKRKERKIPGDDFVLCKFPEDDLDIIKNLAKEVTKKL